MNIYDNLSELKIVDQLGEGGFGQVYLAKQLNIRKEIAVKVMQKAKLCTNEWSIETRKEIFVGLQCYPLITKLIFAKDEGNDIYLGLQYYKGGDLFHPKQKSGRYFSEENTRLQTEEIHMVAALKMLHLAMSRISKLRDFFEGCYLRWNWKSKDD